MMFRLALIAASTVAFCIGEADGPVRLKFSKGQRFHYEIETSAVAGGPGGAASTNTKQTFHVIATVQEVAADGTATLVRRIDRVQINMDGPGGKIEFDSKSEKAAGDALGEIVGNAIKTLIAGDATQKLSASGKMLEFKVSKNIADFLAENPMAAQAGLGESNLRSIAGYVAPEFPQQFIEIGQKWTKVEETEQPIFVQKVTTEYTFDGPGEKDGKKVLKFTARPKMQFEMKPDTPFSVEVKSQESSVEVLFDPEIGQIWQTHGVNKLSIAFDAGGQSGEQEVTAKTSMKLVKVDS